MVWVLLFLLGMAILAYPMWNRREGFKDVKTVFEGKRWEKKEFVEFQNNLDGVESILAEYQDELFVTFEDYKRVMGKMEDVVYKQKDALADLDPSQRKLVVESSGLSENPVDEFYEPLKRARNMGDDPIVTRPGHRLRQDLPRVPIGAFGNTWELSWIHRGDVKSHHDKEEEFYKNVPVYLPLLMASVKEVRTSVRLLRESSGEKAWGMRPRVEEMVRKMPVEEDTDMVSEGFETECVPEKIRVIKTISYSKWGGMARKIRSHLGEIRSLLDGSKNDIRYSETMLESMGEKGKRDRATAQNVL